MEKNLKKVLITGGILLGAGLLYKVYTYYKKKKQRKNPT